MSEEDTVNSINLIAKEISYPSQNLSLILLACNIASFGLQNIIVLPYFVERIQISEFLFLANIIWISKYRFFYYKIWEYCIQNYWTRLIIIFSFSWSLWNSLNVIIHPGLTSVLEAIGRLYLCLAFVIWLLLVGGLNFTKFSRLKYRWIPVIGFLFAVIGIVGYFMEFSGIDNIQANWWENYPYTGTIVRLQSYVETPSYYLSWISIPAIFTLFSIHIKSNSKKFYFIIVCILISAVLSFSKSLILLVGIIFYIIWIIHMHKKSIGPVLLAASILFHTLVVHILITKNPSKYEPTNYTASEYLFRFENYTMLKSCYLSFKEGALKIFAQEPLAGIGPGMFNQGIDNLKADGNYPLQLYSFDAHSSITGTLAENGAVGMLLLIFLSISIIFIIRQLNPHDKLLFSSLFILFGAEGISMDIMNFRHYWFCLALLTVTFLFHNKKLYSFKGQFSI